MNTGNVAFWPTVALQTKLKETIPCTRTSDPFLPFVEADYSFRKQ